MIELDRNATIGEMVSERLDRSRVFEKYGLDYCCGGDRTLSEACSEKGVDIDEVYRELETSDSNRSDNSFDTSAEISPSSLVDHIVDTHHAYLKSELPRLAALIRKVVEKHSEHDARLIEVEGVFSSFAAELEAHWNKEERILFPMIKSLENGTRPTGFPAGMLPNPIRVMVMEHESAGIALARLNALTDGYSPPEFACNTYRAMLDAMAKLETDTHIHIHKENNILFPRAIKLEEKLAGNQ